MLLLCVLNILYQVKLFSYQPNIDTALAAYNKSILQQQGCTLEQ